MTQGPHHIPDKGTVTVKHVFRRDGYRVVIVTSYVDGWGPFFVSRRDWPDLPYAHYLRTALLSIAAVSIGVLGCAFLLPPVFEWARENHGGPYYLAVAGIAALYLCMAVVTVLAIRMFLLVGIRDWD